MKPSTFKQTIQDLNFVLFTEERRGGIIGKNDILTGVSPEILFGMETASKFSADAVYFRYFPDGRASVPQIYFFDYTLRTLTDADRREIHKKMWSGYTVPIYIIIEKSVVHVFDARTKLTTEKQGYAKAILELTGDAIKSFHAADFDDGLFWEEQKEKRFQFEHSATKDLIRGLKGVHKSFQEKSGLDKHVSLKLLVQSLLIKYLEERDEEVASGYFAGTYFKQHFGCNNFCETIRAGKLLDLLDQLAEDFNGKIFEWSKENETEERQAIQRSEIKILADYLDGNIADNQYVLWRLYSFSHLPVEVISSVYEELLTDSKDIVYTPEMIVSTLVDECMPLKAPRKDFKLIDVSCGSGIFLVKAYKRIVQWWRYEQWMETGKLPKPSLSVLKDLLLSSIHGIDIKEDAVRLSIFSLALAILDEVDLDPPTWQALKFPDFSNNITIQNFFEYIPLAKRDVYDLVIGNPPFNLPFVNGKEPSRKKYFNLLRQTKDYRCEIQVPDENPALHFLVQSMTLLKPDAQLCLIQPSGPILYHENMRFKQELFSRYNLQQLIDFTKLPDVWAGANVATVAVFLQKSLPDTSSVLHLVANRTFSNTNRVFLEFDHYDFHFVSKSDVLNNPFVWKANLLGGGRIVDLVTKLSRLRTFRHFLDEKTKSCGWKYSEGYTVGNRKHYAEFIHNKDAVNPKSFKESGITELSLETESHFEAPRLSSKEIYLKPHILIKVNIGKDFIPIAFLDYDAVFSHEIIGVYAPLEQEEELKRVYSILKRFNSLYRFHILATSSRIIIGRASAVLKRDIDNLPFPENTERLKTSFVEDIIIQDVLSHYSQKRSEYEKAIDVGVFSDVFCKTLNSVYEENEKSFKLFKTLDAGKYYALHFEYTQEKTTPVTERVDNIEKYIQEVIPTCKKEQESFHIQRIMKLYGKDWIILVKPKQLRYWLPSIALRDADECFADYIKVRYPYAER